MSNCAAWSHGQTYHGPRPCDNETELIRVGKRYLCRVHRNALRDKGQVFVGPRKIWRRK